MFLTKDLFRFRSSLRGDWSSIRSLSDMGEGMAFARQRELHWMKLTARKRKNNSWKMIFLLGPAYFQGRLLLVSGRVSRLKCILNWTNLNEMGMYKDNLKNQNVAPLFYYPLINRCPAVFNKTNLGTERFHIFGTGLQVGTRVMQ